MGTVQAGHDRDDDLSEPDGRAGFRGDPADPGQRLAHADPDNREEGGGNLPVRGPREQALKALAAELTPAKSLQRLDAATARVVSTISIIIATLLTGLGLIAAGLTNLTETARALAVVTVGLAFLAVLLALIAQILTINRGLNTNNLAEVEHWYRKRMQRAPLTRWATGRPSPSPAPPTFAPAPDGTATAPSLLTKYLSAPPP